MTNAIHFDRDNPSTFIHFTMRLFAACFVLFGIFMEPSARIFSGMWQIFKTPAGLISDSIFIGGVGAAFVNAGLVMLMSTELIGCTRKLFTGVSVAALFLMAGFALFGKDLLNTLPILLGGWLYAKCIKAPFGATVHITLFSTALSPMVTDFSWLFKDNQVLCLLMPILVGVVIGFVVPMVSHYTSMVHQGFNLYNVGFSSGLVGLVLVSIFKSFGFVFEGRMLWEEEHQEVLLGFLLVLLALMAGIGVWINGRKLPSMKKLLSETGQAPSDFIALDGYAAVLLNMALLGVVSIAYVLGVGGPLNGPTIGGILTIVGFGAFGKHLKNITPVVAGLVLFSLASGVELTKPAVMLAALFSTGLAPVAGKFGFVWGVIAGAVHSSVVMNVGVLHAGLNLYNNGFAAGLVCIVLIPIIEYSHEVQAKLFGRKQEGISADEQMTDSMADLMEGVTGGEAEDEDPMKAVK